MKRVRLEAEKCEYLEQDRQIKEQFICGLDDEGMQTKIMSEIKAKSKTDNVTRKQVLMLAKQEEINMMQLRGAGQTNAEAGQTDAKMIRAGTCKYCGSSHPPRKCPVYGKTCTACSKMGHYRKVCKSKGRGAVHEVEIEMGPDSQGEDMEIMSINSLYLNRKWSLIMANLEMQVGETALEIPYKINTGSEGNLMPLYIFQKLFQNMSKEQLKRSVKGNIKVKTYNGMHIRQLGTCMVHIKFKNVKKRCIFFVVPGNGQALLEMPHMTVLNIINLNIDTIRW